MGYYNHIVNGYITSLLKKQHIITDMLNVYIKTCTVEALGASGASEASGVSEVCKIWKGHDNIDIETVQRILSEFDLTSFQMYMLLVLNFTTTKVEEGKDLGLHDN